MLPTAYLLPETPREGLVINLSERRLYHYDDAGALVRVFPVGVGRPGFDTPTMLTETTARLEDPFWVPPESVRQENTRRGRSTPAVVPPGPNNPLGRYAIALSAPGYFLHGTNRPVGVGRGISHGCIRLYDAHIRFLFENVADGTPVRIVRQPIKTGWHEGALYLESHTTEEQLARMDVVDLVATATAEHGVDLDWAAIGNAVTQASGMPVLVSRKQR